MADLTRPLDLTPARRTTPRAQILIRHLRRNFALWAGMGMLVFWVGVIVFAPWIATHDPLAQDLSRRLEAPSTDHWFGTDDLGRDVYSRVMYGARVSLPAALIVVTVIFISGSLLGAVAGFFGGLIDAVIMRLADLTMAFPGIVLALAIASLLGPGLGNMLPAACFVLWPQYARLMRSRVIVIRHFDYITAARAYGSPSFRILLRHVLPNAWTPVIVKAALDIGGILLLLSALSFFGLGVATDTPEWGAMMAQGQQEFFHWWLATFPGLAMFLVILAFNLMSEGLRDWLDPQR